MAETEDLMQLRLRNLGLLRRLRAGQAAVRQLVARAASESSMESSSSSSYDSETSLSPESSSASSSTSSLQDECRMWGPLDTHPRHPCDTAWLGSARSRVSSLPPAPCQRLETPGPPRPCSAPLPAVGDRQEPSTGPCGLGAREAPKSILARQSRMCKPRVTFCEESAVPESSWRLRPYLGYDWIAGSLDSSSPVSTKPEAFFSKLQEFREAHRRECIHSHREPRLQGLQDRDVEKDHECVYSYRVNRRLFLVPSDPGVPCRLCGTPRDQRGPETLADPAQVQVSVPLSVLDPPHQYRVHRRKSFDASDTLALPRHCLLGWDIVPPKAEKSSAPKSLDLWSSVSSEVQRRKLSAASPSRLALPARALAPTPMWSEPPGPTVKP